MTKYALKIEDEVRVIHCTTEDLPLHVYNYVAKANEQLSQVDPALLDEEPFTIDDVQVAQLDDDGKASGDMQAFKKIKI